MLFTPIMLDGSRGQMDVDPGLLAKFKRGKPWKATVTDRHTGKIYAVTGAACSQPNCFCDARVIMEMPGA